MKKLIITGVALIGSLLSVAALSSSPYAYCKTSDSDQKFCQCFYNNCRAVFGNGPCQHDQLYSYLSKTGPGTACTGRGYAPSSKEWQKCVEGIKHFLNGDPCKSQ